MIVGNQDAKFAVDVAYGILFQIVDPMLLKMGLWMDKKGTVLRRNEIMKI